MSLFTGIYHHLGIREATGTPTSDSLSSMEDSYLIFVIHCYFSGITGAGGIPSNSTTSN